MSDQIEVKEQVRWEDLEVGEQQEITEWEEGNEPVPSEYKQGIDYAKPGSRLTALAEANRAFTDAATLASGIIRMFGVTSEQFTQTLRAAFEQQSNLDMNHWSVMPVITSENGKERRMTIDEYREQIMAQCTPSRVNLTGQGND